MIVIFRQKTSLLSSKGRLFEILSIDSHSGANLPPVAILKRKSNFYRQTHLFFEKTELLNGLRNFTILVALHVCCILVMKLFESQKHRTWNNFNGRKLKRKSDLFILIERFCSYFLVMGGKYQTN